MDFAAFVPVMTNFIMSVAVIAKCLGVAPEVIMYASLLIVGMPFVLPIGEAPNAITYDSKQFTTGKFFKHGMAMSIILLVVLGIAMVTIWPMLGMPILANP